MPRCEGRPDGPCPTLRNDHTVRFTQGDLFLCRECDEYRFPTTSVTSAIVETRSGTKHKVATNLNVKTGASATVPATAITTSKTQRKKKQPSKLTNANYISGTTDCNGATSTDLNVAAVNYTDVDTRSEAMDAIDNQVNNPGDFWAKHDDFTEDFGIVDNESDCGNALSCSLCHEEVSHAANSIRCSICCNAFHQECTGLTNEVFNILISIVKHAGWVCRLCRENYGGLQTALNKAVEELADMRSSIAWLYDEIKSLKESTSNSQSTVTAVNQNFSGSSVSSVK